ncbi:hypothetical protein [Jatrophihabitans sp.]|uniref:hypothetical protein n=1 Tax=Jatrophihabitans sp. TaxID=1932789 RepID=UPI0030C68482|nr:hypothetical protein [Jatrophihabitans sp.]
MRYKSTTNPPGAAQQAAAVDPTPDRAPAEAAAPAAEPVPTLQESGQAETTPASAAPAAADTQAWASTFPHVEIDELMNRLSAADSATPGETTALLGAIIDEARRLRSTVVRLTSEKLSAAEQEAEEILAAARTEAAQLRRSANEAMLSRLDEAEAAAAAITQAATVDATRRSRQGQQLLAQTRTEVESLRSRVSAIFDSTNGILPLLGDAAAALGRMETELAAEGAPELGTTPGAGTAPPAETDPPAEVAEATPVEHDDEASLDTAAATA